MSTESNNIKKLMEESETNSNKLESVQEDSNSEGPSKKRSINK